MCSLSTMGLVPMLRTLASGHCGCLCLHGSVVPLIYSDACDCMVQLTSMLRTLASGLCVCACVCACVCVCVFVCMLYVPRSQQK